MTWAALTGFLTAFALILAIGAQNAFVLRQGLLRQHIFALCLLCAVSDAILISAGVAGFGWLVTFSPAFPTIMSLAGAGFLLVYGATRIGAAIRRQGRMDAASGGRQMWRTLVTGLALTWLNPHVYLDTLGLIGAVSTGFGPTAQKIAFAMGAISASFTFFFALGYGARLLAPLLKTARAWAAFDLLIGLLMWALAVGLVWSAV